MLPRFRFVRLLGLVLLICAFSALSNGYAEAEEGLASWYGPGLEGKPTASGVPYDPNSFTAASRTLPLGTRLLVSYGERTVAVTVDDRGPMVEGRDLDLSQAAARALGLTEVGVGEVDWRLADPELSQTAVQWPELAQGVAQQPSLLQGPEQQPDLVQEAVQPQELTKVGVGAVENWRVANTDFPPGLVSKEPGVPQDTVLQPELLQQTTQQPSLLREALRQPTPSQGSVQDQADSGVYVVQPGDTLSQIAAWLGTSVDALARYNGIADPNVIRSGQVLHLLPNSIDPTFIGGQEGFRLDAYVPDPGSSKSGVTVGTGVDIGQMSVADIEALGISQELKQKLEPYAGLIGQEAVTFINNHPLRLTEDEAHALDRVVYQNTIEGVATHFNRAAFGNVFAELPPEARTAITDIAYQYGPNLEQRMPIFWSDVAAGRWTNVIQKLRNFGDRYPTRRNAEADLLERAIQRGDFRTYVVQPGDTLSDIASRLGTSAEYLTSRNGLTDPNTVYTGQALYY